MISLKPKQNRFRVVGSSPADPDSVVNQDRDSAPDTGSEGACPYCFGTGMEVVPGVGARRCRCQSPDYRERLFRAARIPLGTSIATWRTTSWAILSRSGRLRLKLRKY